MQPATATKSQDFNIGGEKEEVRGEWSGMKRKVRVLKLLSDETARVDDEASTKFPTDGQ